jgi:RNA polymerase nonessential primary-like sigma factor
MTTIPQMYNGPLLTAEEEQALARRVHGPDRDDAQAARNELVERNVGLVFKAAKRFAGPWSPVSDDQIQAGMVGLVRAAELFTPRGLRFSTFASKLIHQELLENLERDSPIRVPGYLLAELAKADRGEHVKESTTKLFPLARHALQFHGGVGGEADDYIRHTRKRSSPLHSIPAREEEEHIGDDEAAVVRVAVAKLPRNHRRILEQRFGLNGQAPRTLEKIGEDMGVTRERVRQIEMEGMGKLRELMGVAS